MTPEPLVVAVLQEPAGTRRAVAAQLPSQFACRQLARADRVAEGLDVGVFGLAREVVAAASADALVERTARAWLADGAAARPHERDADRG